MRSRYGKGLGPGILVVALAMAIAPAVPVTPVSVARAEVPELGMCTADANIALGSTGPGVFCLQFALLVMGRYTGPLSSTYDEATETAVAWFQSDNPPLPVDGKGGPATLAAIGIYSGVDPTPPPPPCQADAQIRPNDHGDSVKCVQQRLTDLGLFDGDIDGVYGKTSQAAVVEFQTENPPLVADAVLGPRTLAAMGIWSGITKGGEVTVSPWPAGFQPEPYWHVTQDGIPVYGTRHPCSRADADTIATEFAKDGADIETEQWAVYIASREGNCNYKSVNYNLTTQDDSHCTFQLNALAGMFAPNGTLGRLGWTVDNVKASMANCANAASDLWVYCGRGPWEPPYSCTQPWANDLGANGDE